MLLSPEKARLRRRILDGESPFKRDSEEEKNDFRRTEDGDIVLRVLGGGLGGGMVTRAYFGSGGQSYIR